MNRVLLPHEFFQILQVPLYFRPPVPEIREGRRPPVEAEIEEEIEELIVWFAKLSLGPALAH